MAKRLYKQVGFELEAIEITIDPSAVMGDPGVVVTVEAAYGAEGQGDV